MIAKNRTVTYPSERMQQMTPGRWNRWLENERRPVEQAIGAVLAGAGGPRGHLRKAMRYALIPGGKRLRPGLAVLAYRTCGGRSREIYRLAASIELVHTFTLIHDDLPCMDDDDFRRGRPTCHRAHGEAMAVLAGDALLNLAYAALADLRVAPERKIAVIRTLADAVGTAGVLAGQVDDIEAEGRRVSESMIRRIHERKTASLIAASLRMGGELAGAARRRLDAFDRFGRSLGLLFQLVDDLLNVAGTEAELGRPAGGDERKAKATYPRIIGMAGAGARARRLARDAEISADAFGGSSPVYRDLVRVVVGRVALPVRRGP